MSFYAQELVAYLNWADRALDFWEQHSDRLTMGEAERVAAGDYGSLVRPLEPTWMPGEWLNIASNLWIKPEPAQWRRNGYRIPFSVRDFRPRLVRRVPQVLDLPELDELGAPIAPTLGAIEAARQDGSYTQARGLAIPDDNDGVDDHHLALFTAEAAAKRALGDSDATKERLAEIHRLPSSRRITELLKLADERGVDTRDDEKAFERRIRRRLEAA